MKSLYILFLIFLSASLFAKTKISFTTLTSKKISNSLLQDTACDKEYFTLLDDSNFYKLNSTNLSQISRFKTHNLKSIARDNNQDYIAQKFGKVFLLNGGGGGDFTLFYQFLNKIDELQKIINLDKYLVLVADNNKVFRLEKHNKNLKIFQTSHKQKINDIIQISQDKLISASWDKTIFSYDINSLKTEKIFNNNSPLWSLDYCKNENKLLVSDFSGSVFLLDLDKRAKTEIYHSKYEADSLICSKDIFFIGLSNGKIIAIERRLSQIFTYDAHKDRVREMFWNEENQNLTSFSWDMQVKVFQVKLLPNTKKD